MPNFLRKKNLFVLILLFTLNACATQVEEIAPPIIPKKIEEPTKIRLIFTGDIMVHARQLEIAKIQGNSEQTYDFSKQFEHVSHLMQGDLVIGNLETTLKGTEPYLGYPAFNSPDSLITALKTINFNVLFLANNHILDHGATTALRTKAYTESQGITTVGLSTSKASMNWPILDIKGFKIGFINATYGSNYPLKTMAHSVYFPMLDTIDINSEVENLRSRGADFIIASFHWGMEYGKGPDYKQKALAQRSFEAGVDVIVGHHPHVLQEMEIIQSNGQDKFIAWSLGNFISSQRTLPRERTIILALDLEAKPRQELLLKKVSAAPLWVDLVSRVRARLLPTQYAELSQQSINSNSAIYREIKNSLIQKKLTIVHAQIIKLLNLKEVDEQGFYTFWQKPNV